MIPLRRSGLGIGFLAIAILALLCAVAFNAVERKAEERTRRRLEAKEPRSAQAARWTPAEPGAQLAPVEHRKPAAKLSAPTPPPRLTPKRLLPREAVPAAVPALLARAPQAEREFNRISPGTGSTPQDESQNESVELPQDAVTLPGDPDDAPQPWGYVAFPPEDAGNGEQEDAPASNEPPSTGGGGANPDGGAPPPPNPASIPRISLALSSSPVRAGETVRLEVRITSGVDVSAVPFDLRFDAALLRYERAYQGEFLGRLGTPPILLVAPIGDGSSITVGLSQPGTGPGVSGSGMLLVLEFRALAPGTSVVTFDTPHLLNSRRREIAAEFLPSQVVIL